MSKPFRTVRISLCLPVTVTMTVRPSEDGEIFEIGTIQNVSMPTAMTINENVTEDDMDHVLAQWRKAGE